MEQKKMHAKVTGQVKVLHWLVCSMQSCAEGPKEPFGKQPEKSE